MKGVVKFERFELVSIISPFNSITAIMLVELSSPSSVMKSLFLSENKLIDKEIITIMDLVVLLSLILKLEKFMMLKFCLKTGPELLVSKLKEMVMSILYQKVFIHLVIVE